jgi:hypothetical protein
VESFCERAANAGAPAGNQNCIAGDLHDLLLASIV